MKDWKPKVNPAAKLTSLKLTMEAGFVLSRLDGQTRVGELPLLTGLAEPVLVQALTLLLQEGAILPDGAPEALLPRPPEPVPVPVNAPVEPPAASPEALAKEPPAAPSIEEVDLDAPLDPDVDRGDYRKLYSERCADMVPGARAALASQTSGDLLNALCFDPVAAVLKSLFENERANVTHARLVAVHHRTVAGIEMVVRHATYARDAQVRRLLLRNPVVTEPLFKRLFANARLGDLFKIVQGHEATEHAKRALRNHLRERFGSSPAEAKAELIFATEGRALAILIGLALDGATTAILCARNYTSLILIQNLARWPATPSAVLRHLLGQPLVNRNPGIKTLIKRHPNLPSDLKER